MTSTSFNGINWTSTTENFTEDATVICRRVKPQQIASLCFSFIAAIYLMYLVTTLCIYSHKKKLMIGCRGTQISSGDQAVSVINFVTVCGAIFVFVFVAFNISLLIPPTDLLCNIYDRITTTSYGGAVFCAYFALWYRMHSIFYANPFMKQSISKPLRILNIVTVILVILVVVINLTIFLSSPAYANMPCACRAVHSDENNLAIWIILIASTIASQVTLLFTFVYPLHLHRKKTLNRHTDQKSIFPVVKKASVVAGICVVSDLLNFAFAVVYKGETILINHIVHSCNLIINLMGVVFTFANWREKLLPCRKNNNRVRTTSGNTDYNSRKSSNTEGTTYV